jgi:hypothetical protein
MKGIRAQIEDLNLVVVKDRSTRNPDAFVVRLEQPGMRVIARYDVTEDGHYRFGWIEHPDGKGRTDCLDWLEFHAELQLAAANQTPTF